MPPDSPKVSAPEATRFSVSRLGPPGLMARSMPSASWKPRALARQKPANCGLGQPFQPRGGLGPGAGRAEGGEQAGDRAGETPKAAGNAGISAARMRHIGTLISGTAAGASGSYVMLAEVGLFRETIVSGQGFIALA